MKKGNWCVMKTKNEVKVEKIKTGGRKRKERNIGCLAYVLPLRSAGVETQ